MYFHFNSQVFQLVEILLLYQPGDLIVHGK